MNTTRTAHVISADITAEIGIYDRPEFTVTIRLTEGPAAIPDTTAQALPPRYRAALLAWLGVEEN